MERKFTNLNNDVSRLIISHSSIGNALLAFEILIAHRIDYDESVFLRLLKLIFELSPLTYSDYKKMHPQFKNYISNLYDKYIAS